MNLFQFRLNNGYFLFQLIKLNVQREGERECEREDYEDCPGKINESSFYIGYYYHENKR